MWKLPCATLIFLIFSIILLDPSRYLQFLSKDTNLKPKTMERKDSILTHDMAIARGNSIVKDSISYDVELTIPKGKGYSGKITVEFSCTGTVKINIFKPITKNSLGFSLP